MNQAKDVFPYFFTFCIIILSGFLFFLSAPIPYSTAASESISGISSYVTDSANVFGPVAKAALENRLRSLESNTNGVQFVVFVEKKIPEGSTLEERSLSIAENNRIGQKGNDNGILLYVATEDRQFRWETGYGIEGTLSTSLLGRISRQYMIPEFQQGNFSQGILSGVDIVERILLNSTDADIMKLKEETNKSRSKWIIYFIIILLIIGLIMAIELSRQSSRLSGQAKFGKKEKHDNVFINAASVIFFGGRGGAGGFSGGGGLGGFSGGGGSFGGGGFSGRF